MAYHVLAIVKLPQITCNGVLAMAFFINRNDCHIITYEVLYESLNSSEMNGGNCLKIGHPLIEISRDCKQHVETSVASHRKQFEHPIASQ